MTAQTRLFLTLLAGYCDTVTFVHMHGIFSAHVTGNFVLFAAAMGRGLAPADYLKLWTFPVFIAAIMISTVLYLSAEKRGGTRFSGLTRVIGMMTLSLAAASGLAFIAPVFAVNTQADIAITMLVVLAMGLQNALHHFIPGAMTTVMTGTVMNAVAKFTQTLLGRTPAATSAAAAVKAVNPVWMILLFGAGCVAGGFAARALAFQGLLPAAICCGGLWLWERKAVRSRVER